PTAGGTPSGNCYHLVFPGVPRGGQVRHRDPPRQAGLGVRPGPGKRLPAARRGGTVGGWTGPGGPAAARERKTGPWVRAAAACRVVSYGSKSRRVDPPEFGGKAHTGIAPGLPKRGPSELVAGSLRGHAPNPVRTRRSRPARPAGPA